MNEKATDSVYKPDDTVNSLKFQISRQEKEANELRIRSFWSERRRKKEKLRKKRNQRTGRGQSDPFCSCHFRPQFAH